MVQCTDDREGLRGDCGALQGGGTWRARNYSNPDDSILIGNTLEGIEPSTEREGNEIDSIDVGDQVLESETQRGHDILGTGLPSFKRGNGSK